MERVVLRVSPNKDKLLRVEFSDGKTIDFGSSKYQQYIIHKDVKRKNSYIARHYPNEDWDKSGIRTAGFWSRWILWNKPTLVSAIKDLEKNFGIKVQLRDD